MSKQTIKELINIYEKKNQVAESLSGEYWTKESKFKQEIKRLKKEMREAQRESQKSHMDIWYIFGLQNEDDQMGKGSGRKEYTEQEKQEAKEYYYRRVK